MKYLYHTYHIRALHEGYLRKFSTSSKLLVSADALAMLILLFFRPAKVNTSPFLAIGCPWTAPSPRVDLVVRRASNSFSSRFCTKSAVWALAPSSVLLHTSSMGIFLRWMTESEITYNMTPDWIEPCSRIMKIATRESSLLFTKSITLALSSRRSHIDEHNCIPCAEMRFSPQFKSIWGLMPFTMYLVLAELDQG